MTTPALPPRDDSAASSLAGSSRVPAATALHRQCGAELVPRHRRTPPRPTLAGAVVVPLSPDQRLGVPSMEPRSFPAIATLHHGLPPPPPRWISPSARDCPPLRRGGLPFRWTRCSTLQVGLRVSSPPAPGGAEDSVGRGVARAIPRSGRESPHPPAHLASSPAPARTPGGTAAGKRAMAAEG
uniref:Uncharacterized protein n=1 Tax=Oryza glumipatula TaxID=40148 RepID=A0A0E0BHF1_9ORYZ